VENIDSTPIVGVFRDQAKADHAIEELKQADFTEDHITSKVVGMHTASGEETPEEYTRIVVVVKADGRGKQAFGILFSNGANNADLPPGMTLSGTNLTSEGETVDLIPNPELEGSFPKDSFFGAGKDLETTDQLGQMDKL
jgi:hypothetical protein